MEYGETCQAWGSSELQVTGWGVTTCCLVSLHPRVGGLSGTDLRADSLGLNLKRVVSKNPSSHTCCVHM